MKKSLASLRFLAMFLGVILVFGLGGSLILAAFDKEETSSPAPLFNVGVIFHGVVHFIQTLFFVAFSGTNHFGAHYWTFFLTGFATTIQFCFISMPLALVTGFIVALMSQSKLRIIRLPARAFVEFIRNTPLLVQMMVIYLGLSFLPQWLVNPFTAGVATLTINYCAYECENLRAGLSAVDRGQNEAAATLGLGLGETLRLILVPQMIPISLPTVINDLIYMFKDSSILSLIAVLELTAQTNGLVRHFPVYTWQFFMIGSLLYLALSLPLGRVARTIEARLRAHSFGQGRDLTTLTGQTLAASVIVGWLAGALGVGISLGILIALLGKMIVALVLTLTLLIGIMLILGIPVYAVATLIRSLRRGARSKPPASPQPTSVPAGITGAKM
ncbi:MAG TPA: amino acid ABC transporter permease [Ktedonobacterales bacterium]|nr:amino acid ABC transporter permease [Ktedonobacterales bacterium]